MANNFEMPVKRHYTHKVNIIGRRRDLPNENLVSVQVEEGNAMAYFDMLKLAIENKSVQYLIVEPVFLEDLNWLDGYTFPEEKLNI